ncbi:globin domain-containing protein [Streptacidiphilus fuscans]|uniref:nitric oxide dioxygenase n=1 Tax=Streptacidiphilus fuscans TaxID=2789292 RepID=A0A931AZ60_9ACTN|nr:globin domain-containing protein [Streptacidiphilus fuscans]MBF9068129.1 flavohemoprotein [Streptacidiphilus fuscans]
MDAAKAAPGPSTAALELTRPPTADVSELLFREPALLEQEAESGPHEEPDSGPGAAPERESEAPASQLQDQQDHGARDAEASGPGQALALRPDYSPMFTDAPALNWAGPDDAWSRAWTVPVAPAQPVPPMPIVPAPVPVPSGISTAPLPPPPLPLPGSVVAVVPLASRQRQSTVGRGAETAASAGARTAAGSGTPAAQAGSAGVMPRGPVGPTPQDIVLIRRSLSQIEPIADRATAHFYAVLFLERPELRALFPAAMDVHRDRLFRALLEAGRAADDPPQLVEYLEGLARSHRKYGVRDEHYAPVCSALLAALERYCGREWTAATGRAWSKVFAVISQVMMAAAAREAQSSPAWWQGEVRSVERVGRDVAVVTLSTDQPYPYQAGQYADVEVPWWPRVWRRFSMASAPEGENGLLRFHVKAVPAGWVSNALVHRAQPGDVVRLGPPSGSMVVDPAAPEPLLLVGGGTGIGAIIAIVEELAKAGTRRRVEVFYGARRAEDCYADAGLRELDRALPWLTVRTSLSEPEFADFPGAASTSAATLRALPAGTAAAAADAADPAGPADPADLVDGKPERGMVSEVLARFGPWEGYEACLSGPSAMIRRVRAMLLSAGVPAERIHDDLDSSGTESGAEAGSGT